MPRSHGQLWEHVSSPAALEQAYRRARLGKRFRSEVATFELRRDVRLRSLADRLRAGSWRPGGYRHFTIQQSKPRVISAAPFEDRIVHHALVGAVEPVFERRFLPHSYACRVGRGTHRALDHAQRGLARSRFVLQCDVQRFFPSIDHEVALGVFRRTVRDRRVNDLLACIVASGADVPAEAAPPWLPGDDLLVALRPRGLPIGNLTSQFLGNVVLDPLDHYVLETLRPTTYVRYCDDFLVFGDDRSALAETREAIRVFLAGLRLHLHPRKAFVRPSLGGIRFLGVHLRARTRRLLQEGVSRASRRLGSQGRGWRAGRLTDEHVRASVAAWCGHAGHPDHAGIRRQLLSRAGLLAFAP